MAPTVAQLLKIGAKLDKKAGEFCATFQRLLDAFAINCSDNSDFIQLVSLWKIARKIAGIGVCANEIARRINIYKDDILSEQIEKLYNEDYSKHIVKNTSPNTIELINQLIVVFRRAWDNSDDRIRDVIKDCFKKLATQSTEIIRLDNKLNS